MFSKLFEPTGPKLVPMKMQHMAEALAIIAETDEDDAEEARIALEARNCGGMFVLTLKHRIIGITGAVLTEGSDDIAWLSWTYLTQDARQQGLGRFMIDQLLGELKKYGVRKIFIATSDYREGGVEIYADAQVFYGTIGASEEMRVPDYHEAGETKIVFGLENPEAEHRPTEPLGPITGIRFGEITPAIESDRGVTILWELTGDGINGLSEAVDEAVAGGARIIVLSLPEDASAIAKSALQAAGFAETGRLLDFHEPGVADIWWIKTI